MKRRVTAIVLCLFLMIPIYGIPAYAQGNDSVITLSKERTSDEVSELMNIYSMLFPDEFHYIEKYEQEGVTNMPQDEIETIFYGSKELGNTTYDLIVMNNGQIFTNISEYTVNTRSTLRYGKFQVGDLGKYIVFECYYKLNSGYDEIVECNDIRAINGGFLIYPTNLKKKYKENSSGPAYHAYTNVHMDGGTVLYDIGVAVGKDKAKGITQISTGADMWVWSMLNSFFGL